MKSLLDKIYESSKESKYDTTIFDSTNSKKKKLIPSDDENKNFIIARLCKHFSWYLKGRSHSVDDYIEKNKENSYWMNVYNADYKDWESEKYRNAKKIGTATTTNINKALRLYFTFNNDKLYVVCHPGVQRTIRLGIYDIEDNPIDKEYEDHH